MSKHLFQLPNPKNDVVWGSQKSQVPPAYQVKGSSKWLIWGGMTGRGLTNLHFIPQVRNCDSRLEKEVKPLLNRRSTTEIPIKRKLFSLNQKMTLVQDGALAHTAKSTQNWCKRNLPKLTENSPDLNPVENLRGIMDENTYRDPEPKTTAQIKRRLSKAWANIPLTTLQELSHSMPQCLRNVIKNKGGHAGY